MKNRRSKIAAALALMALAVFAMGATVVETTLVPRGTGGSTGDSVIATADTSSWLRISDKTEHLYVMTMNDSASTYRTQVSADTTNWFTVDFDTVTAGEAEATADFGNIYNGMAIRVVRDLVAAGEADYGRTYIVESK